LPLKPPKIQRYHHFPCHPCAEDVQVRIESVDLDSNKMNLSMRGLVAMGWHSEEMCARAW
jgi:hypothetical protein